MGETQYVKKYFAGIDPRDMGETFDEAIKYFQDLKEMYKDQELYLSYDSDGMVIVERRLETPLEQSNREQLAARHKAERERIDLETLARLKAQYEPTKT